MQKIKPSFLFALCVWSLLILRFGYRFGTGDQVELLPYTLFLHNHSLYPHDFFIQGLNAAVPNERTVMAWLLLPFLNHLEIFCFLFQFASTVVLVMGLERLARKFIQNKYLAWLSVLVALILLNDYALGNVEVYSECLQASSVATAIIAWALVLFLENRFVAASVLITIASFIQVLEGLDVMMVLSLVLLFAVLKKQVPAKTLAISVSIFAFTAGLYMLWIFAAKNGSGIAGCKPPSNAELFKILFAFRHPHHFIFTSFPRFKAVVFFALTFLALYFYRRRSAPVFQFLLIGLCGVLVYAVATDVFHFVFVANFQFYKVTQWMKFFGVVASIGLLEQASGSVARGSIAHGLNRGLWNPGLRRATFIAVAAFSWLLIWQFRYQLPYHVPYQIFGWKEEDDMINICGQIQSIISPDAVFIQPVDNSEFKYYGRRSSFVEFKANVRHKCFVEEWYRRVKLVYDISAEDTLKGFALQQKADAHYYSLTLHELALLQKEGVTHMLVKKDEHPHSGTLILSNQWYAVYKL